MHCFSMGDGSRDDTRSWAWARCLCPCTWLYIQTHNEFHKSNNYWQTTWKIIEILWVAHKNIVISYVTNENVKQWNKHDGERLNSVEVTYYNLQVIIGETIDKAKSGPRPLLLPVETSSSNCPRGRSKLIACACHAFHPIVGSVP
jgi:hypothetical protein